MKSTPLHGMEKSANTEPLEKHPRFNRYDSYHLLTRSEQVAIFRLRTGHTRLNYHLFNKLKIGQSDKCPCIFKAADRPHPPELPPL